MLGLGNFLYLAVKLGCGCLVKPGYRLQSKHTDGFENAQCSKTVRICCVLRRLKRHFDMALRRQVVNFIRLNLLDDSEEVRRIRKVCVVQNEAHIFLMRVSVKMINALRVEKGRTTLEAMNGVTFFKQEFREVGTVLACNTGY